LSASSQLSLQETIEVWQPHSPDPLTLVDADEISKNVLGFMNVLARIDQRVRRESETQTGLSGWEV